MELLKLGIFSLVCLCLTGSCFGGKERCVASIGGACPPAWIQWGDKCYRATGRLTWHQAKQECTQMGSVLVVPQSRAETEFLLSLVDTNFWIDCNDLQREGWLLCLMRRLSLQLKVKKIVVRLMWYK